MTWNFNKNEIKKKKLRIKNYKFISSNCILQALKFKLNETIPLVFFTFTFFLFRKQQQEHWIYKWDESYLHSYFTEIFRVLSFKSRYLNSIVYCSIYCLINYFSFACSYLFFLSFLISSFFFYLKPNKQKGSKEKRKRTKKLIFQ